MNALVLAADDGLVNGNFDLSDVLMLVAFIVFVVAAVISVMEKSVVMFLAMAGLALMALAFFVA